MAYKKGNKVVQLSISQEMYNNLLEDGKLHYCSIQSIIKNIIGEYYSDMKKLEKINNRND
jgi:hypothetical protein